MKFAIPRPSPSEPFLEKVDGCTLRLNAAEPWGHLVAIVNKLRDSPLEIESKPASPPVVIRDAQVVCDGAEAIVRALMPEDGPEADVHLQRVADLVDRVYLLGRIDDQGEYETAHHDLKRLVDRFDRELATTRFLAGDAPGVADYLLVAFSMRLDLVYYDLYKATIGRLADFPRLEAHARDLFEQPAVWSTTSFDEIRRSHYRDEPVLNPSGIVPRGGEPDLDGPHFRPEAFGGRSPSGVEEDSERSRGEGEWVRPQSELRHWIRAESDARFPAEAGRYHIYAPFNCPWSHRVLLARSVKGLDEVVGASIAYFRRDPERGWQFNPAIPGATADLVGGRKYVVELYESIGSDERSVPVLWDTKQQTIVNNESAEILRMFNESFGDLATNDIDLYPEGYRDEIDRINGAVYHRINNGAYKAGFSSSQPAYDRAFARYFRALRWLDELLEHRSWLAGTEAATEADLRLFPTVFRHDEVYYSRFKLNAAKLDAYPRLADWLDRMMQIPGVAEASDLDHARNGYFGRTGNEIVPAGPSPLGLSRKDFSDEVWLNRSDA